MSDSELDRTISLENPNLMLNVHEDGDSDSSSSNQMHPEQLSIQRQVSFTYPTISQTSSSPPLISLNDPNQSNPNEITLPQEAIISFPLPTSQHHSHGRHSRHHHHHRGRSYSSKSSRHSKKMIKDRSNPKSNSRSESKSMSHSVPRSSSNPKMKSRSGSRSHSKSIPKSRSGSRCRSIAKEKSRSKSAFSAFKI